MKILGKKNVAEEEKKNNWHIHFTYWTRPQSVLFRLNPVVDKLNLLMHVSFNYFSGSDGGINLVTSREV